MNVVTTITRIERDNLYYQNMRDDQLLTIILFYLIMLISLASQWRSSVMINVIIVCKLTAVLPSQKKIFNTSINIVCRLLHIENMSTNM